MAQLIKNPYDFYKVLTFKWHLSKFEPNWIVSLQLSYLSAATVANFQNHGKIWILYVDKALLSDVGGGYCSSKVIAWYVIWTMLCWKQLRWYADLKRSYRHKWYWTLGLPKFGSCPRKHQKTPLILTDCKLKLHGIAGVGDIRRQCIHHFACVIYGVCCVMVSIVRNGHSDQV